MSEKKIVRFKKICKLDSDYFLIYSSKMILLKSNIKFPSQNIQDTEKMLGNKIVYFEKIYNFGLKHFFIEVISFVH